MPQRKKLYPATNSATVLNAAARQEVRRLDAALRADVGPAPTEEQVLDAISRFFPRTHMNDRQKRQYARSVIAGRPHLV